MRLTFTTISIAMAMFTSSCSRNLVDRTPNAILQGVWNYGSSTGQLHSYVEDHYHNDIYRTDTVFSYISKNGFGSITVTADSIYCSGLSYGVADTIHIRHYKNMIDEFPQDPPTSYYVSYQDLKIPLILVGADSMYFPSGFTLRQPDNLGLPSPVQFKGTKYSLRGDTLTLISVTSVDAVYPYDTGLPDTPMYHLDAVITSKYYK